MELVEDEIDPVIIVLEQNNAIIHQERIARSRMQRQKQLEEKLIFGVGKFNKDCKLFL